MNLRSWELAMANKEMHNERKRFASVVIVYFFKKTFYYC